MYRDVNGNLIDDGDCYTYNSVNQLVQVVSQTGSKESNYYYANGLRAVAQNNTKVLVHYYSRNNALLNTSDGTQHSSAYLIANNVAVRSVNGDATVLLHNRHGSVIAQLGDKSQFYQYSVYGVQRTEDGGQRTDSGSGTLDLAMNPLRYSGYMFDPLTGLYYLKARDYNPHLRSFIQADSYAFNNQGLINGYFYGNNNPLMGIDPSGHMDIPAIDEHTPLLNMDSQKDTAAEQEKKAPRPLPEYALMDHQYALMDHLFSFYNRNVEGLQFYRRINLACKMAVDHAVASLTHDMFKNFSDFISQFIRNLPTKKQLMWAGINLADDVNFNKLEMSDKEKAQFKSGHRILNKRSEKLAVANNYLKASIETQREMKQSILSFHQYYQQTLKNRKHMLGIAVIMVFGMTTLLNIRAIHNSFQ
ncbi:RHS repeat domain-containing protein [Cysteiniphilum halobium]|uniref:RHS repeat domain-containing protein n=1 Tax=Cysteiniphilum halobium TaxID=2219059 RepID=UPI0013C31347|nr:RHS repeat-associated core domain-containing protein [Cysteiniphilum halobium]